jgi:hypothetical protein
MLGGWQEPDAPTTQPGTAGRALRVAWCALVEHSTGWERVPVCFNEERAVWVPTQGNQGDDRHPDAFYAVLEHMTWAHRAQHEMPAASLAELTLLGFHTAILCPEKAHLAEYLAQIAYTESRPLDEDPDMKGAMYKLITKKMSHHPRPNIDKIAFALMVKECEGRPPKIKEEWKEAIKNALNVRLQNGDRDVVREFVTTFGAALGDVVTGEMLYEYISRVCEPLDNGIAMHIGEGPHRAWCEQKKRDLQQFLEVGAFDPDVLAKALKLAGEKGCGIGVEVLASPPHNARTPEDSPFVQCILQELLKPEGEVAKQAGEEFSKRQKLEA